MEKIEKKLNRFRNGIIFDTLITVDIREKVGVGLTVTEIFECVLFKEKFKIPSPR